MNKRRQTCILTALAAGVLILSGCGHKKSANGGAGGAGGAGGGQTPPTTVKVVPIATGTIAQTVPVVGSLQTLFSINLSPQTAGRLTSVNVREGDTVRKGQVLAQIDQTAADAEVRQDEANVLSAQAKVGQAQATYVQSQSNANIAIQNANVAITSAKASLNEVTVGNRPQQTAQVYDQLIQQQANFSNADTAYKREQTLFNAGAVAQADLDNAQTTYATQKALLDSYQQAYALAKAGGRSEDVETSQANLTTQRQNLRNAYANLANVAVNKQAVVAAQAAVAQTQAALVSAQQDLANTNLVSPIDGVVSARNQDPGSIAQPGTAVLQVVDLKTMYYQPTVSETQFVGISIGQSVEINVDAYPNQTFMGKVAQIYPSASTSDRQFSIRVTIPNTTGALRPGMYARGIVTTRTDHNVIVIPVSAMQPQSAESGFSVNDTSNGLATGGTSLPPQMVYLAGPDNKAHQQNIVVGIVDNQNAEVTFGLHRGDKLIVLGQGELQDGSPVKIIGGKQGHGQHAAAASATG